MTTFLPTSDGRTIDAPSSSDRLALSGVPSHGAAVRLVAQTGPGHFKFGDSSVVASATDGSYISINAVEHVRIPAGATHVAYLGGKLNVTVGYLP